MVKKIGFGSDHAGFDYKEDLKKWVLELGYTAEDYGVYSEEPGVDYKPVEKLTDALLKKEIDRGILICGTGIAISIAANKVKGIRAALCNDLYTARKSREHNDVNVLALGSRVIGLGVAKEMVKIWLETEFEGGRHIQRNKFVSYLEEKN